MLFNKVFIKLINTILESNPGSRKLLANYYGLSFKLIFPGFNISATCDIDGLLIANNGINYDVIINIPPDSAVFLIDKDKLTLYKKISFNGNTSFGRELLEILSKLHL
ncbi:MAG: hypothetical protein K0R49_292, partial [Burkholderiales bacterium]|nr:hypothetical protein [Burkholderiales bacterium]